MVFWYFGTARLENRERSEGAERSTEKIVHRILAWSKAGLATTELDQRTTRSVRRASGLVHTAIWEARPYLVLSEATG